MIAKQAGWQTFSFSGPYSCRSVTVVACLTTENGVRMTPSRFRLRQRTKGVKKLRSERVLKESNQTVKT